jgi:hypothetical protein
MVCRLMLFPPHTKWRDPYVVDCGLGKCFCDNGRLLKLDTETKVDQRMKETYGVLNWL